MAKGIYCIHKKGQFVLNLFWVKIMEMEYGIACSVLIIIFFISIEIGASFYGDYQLIVNIKNIWGDIINAMTWCVCLQGKNGNFIFLNMF